MQQLNQLILDENGVAFHPMMGNSYELNATGRYIIEALKKNQSSDEIIMELSQRYKISTQELYIDVYDFISKLKMYGLA